ncbi:MAG: hypothetical protein HHJ09_13225 [Glaciimonas sp.]|nr:hypothetical protein [Glaciimonas sp.]
MHKSLTAFIAMLSLSAFSSTFASEVVICDNDKQFRPKGSREVHLKLTFKRNILQRLEYLGSTVSGEEGGAYSCSLDVQRCTPKTLWKTNGTSTKIWLEENLTQEDPNIEILVSGKSTDVKMYMGQTPYCGFGAEFPTRITKLPNGSCRVAF